MREILFRGKRVDNGEWVDGYYVRLNRKRHLIYSGFAETDCDSYYPNNYEIDPKTLGEYTGLTDKNGRRIFEGDIVHAIYRSDYVDEKDIDFGNGIIEYHGGYYGGAQWEINTIDEPGNKVFSAKIECEIIGNIYDNPELLEGGESNA